MDRRAFPVALIVACGCTQNETPKKKDAETSGSRPQSAGGEAKTSIPRVAMLSFGSRGGGNDTTLMSSAALLVRARLTELGHVDGKTIRFEESYADGDPQRLTQLARELVESKPDVIVAIAAAATGAVRQATSTIPIVMAHAGDPIATGVAVSLSHPGGNITGTTSMIPDLGVKQVELLRELLPRLAKLGVLANPTNAGAPALLANVKEAARRFNMSVVVAEVTRAEDFDKALSVLRDARPDALLVAIEPMIFVNRARVLDFAAASRLPASFDVGGSIVRQQGGLMSYGPVLTNHYALVAEYVDKILRGAKPGDLPIQQPTQFALVINLKTAKALGLNIPQSLLLRADEVIQ